MTMTTIGARWIRAALQVNPYGYIGQNAPSAYFPNEKAYNSALISALTAKDIGLIALTDHWNVESATGLIADATATGIVALPGFEANSAEGIHLLVIFEAGTDQSSINAAIGACGAKPAAPNGTTGDSYSEILEAMASEGALVIPAHANVANSGMLTGRTGIPLVNMIHEAQLHAIAISPGTTAAADQEAIIRGLKPFDRLHPLSIIHADDVNRPESLTNPGTSTWFKVSTPCLESLKLAVRTPSTRVSIVDPTTVPRALVREISWTGGFLDGVTIPFADDLTTLIGGRGTGKSTVIESLRFALDVEPISDTTRADHAGIVSNVLQSGTTVRVVIDAVTPSESRFVIERSVPNPPIVRDSSGTATAQKPLDVVGPIEIFGQHELAELAQSKSSVAVMIQRFSGTVVELDAPDVRRKLKENRKHLAQSELDLTELDGELADIPRLEEQIARFKATNLPDRLEEQSRLVQDEAIFKESEGRLNSARSFLRDLDVSNISAVLSAGLGGIEGSTQEQSLRRVEAAVQRLGREIHDATASLTASLSAAEHEISGAKEEWQSLTDPLRAGHAGVRRQLVAEGHDPDKYLSSTKALEALNSRAQRREGLSKQIESLAAERVQLLGELASTEAEQSKALNAAIRTANEATTGTVVVRPIPSPDRKMIMGVIDRHLRGIRTQVRDAVKADGFSPRAFATAAREGRARLTASYGIRGAQLDAVLSPGEALFRELEELSVGQAVDVLLNVAQPGDKQILHKLDALSKGQRATALLLLLLGASASPLVIDQPEDDLDNRFVYDGVVQKLRALKGRRQIIASTHNANVPVLGDAELIITLEGDGLKGRPASDGVGSLDDPLVRRHAERLLEGGKDAFDARHHLYGF
ncbi:hypothetical protein OG474_40055 [Kribbella sp. NBC_01505]|uniref:TrlF family AAA-like ATPase n=1 Tax=Kribbella sp. NBC_01505 TaxID=2903580 RepID=UPI003869A348